MIVNQSDTDIFGPFGYCQLSFRPKDPSTLVSCTFSVFLVDGCYGSIPHLDYYPFAKVNYRSP